MPAEECGCAAGTAINCRVKIKVEVIDQISKKKLHFELKLAVRDVIGTRSVALGLVSPIRVRCFKAVRATDPNLGVRLGEFYISCEIDINNKLVSNQDVLAILWD